MRNVFAKLPSIDDVFNFTTKKDIEILDKLSKISSDIVIDATTVPTVIKTTEKTPIKNNRIKLPSKPEGDLLFGMMIVFENEIDGRAKNYVGVTVLHEANEYYAVLNEPNEIVGFGIVSYLTKI